MKHDGQLSTNYSRAYLDKQTPTPTADEIDRARRVIARYVPADSDVWHMLDVTP